MQSQCKLCQSFAASEIPTAAERGFPGSDTFTRDRDICDGCLGHNYARGPGFFDFIKLSCLALATPVASLTALILVALGFVPIASSRFLSLLVLTAIGTLVFGAIIWLALRVIFRIRASTAHQDPEENRVEGERFYWLAVWSALTGHSRFKRRMLRNARAVGFNDPVRLSDPRLEGMR